MGVSTNGQFVFFHWAANGVDFVVKGVRGSEQSYAGRGCMVVGLGQDGGGEWMGGAAGAGGGVVCFPVGNIEDQTANAEHRTSNIQQSARACLETASHAPIGCRCLIL